MTKKLIYGILWAITGVMVFFTVVESITHHKYMIEKAKRAETMKNNLKFVKAK